LVTGANWHWGKLAVKPRNDVSHYTTTLSSTLFSASRQLTALLRWLNKPKISVN